MKICLVHWAYYPVTGGVETHLLTLSNQIKLRGDDVLILTGGTSSTKIINGVSIVYTPLLDLKYLKKKVNSKKEINRKLEKFFEKILLKFKIELVHSHNLHHFVPQPAVSLSLICKKLNIPTVHTIHEIWGNELCLDLLNKDLWDEEFVVSYHVKNHLKQLTNGKEEKVVQLGIDTHFFKPSQDRRRFIFGKENQRGKIILHPARMLPWKGVKYSLEALKSLIPIFPDLLLVITDTRNIIDWNNQNNHYRTELFKYIKKNELEKNVVIKDFNYKIMPRVYNSVDIVIYPTSENEPFGLVPLEAMATERPLIISSTGGMMETVVKNRTGIIIPPKNSQALAKEIKRVIEHSPFAKKLGQKGREHVLNNFSVKIMMDKIYNIYDQANENSKKLFTENFKN